MNEIVNKFSLPVDKFMPELHLRQSYLPTVLADHLLKRKKKYKN